MNLETMAQIVEDMALQHSYPGYDVRSLKMGLPAEVTKAPGRLFSSALDHRSAVVRLAALRWFQEKPGVGKQFIKSISKRIEDEDEWVRAETALCLERIGKVDDALAISLSSLLKDSDANVRKATAKALGKLGCNNEQIITALHEAAQDSDHEVRWKVTKALRQLGAYVA